MLSIRQRYGLCRIIPYYQSIFLEYVLFCYFCAMFGRGSRIIFVFFFLGVLSSCYWFEAPYQAAVMEDVGTTSFENLSTEYKNREVWQKPNEVVDLLGNIQGLKVGDIGSGTGYFTFRLAMKGAHVLAVDIDPAMTEMVELFKQNLSSDIRSRIKTRNNTAHDPKIADGELDKALMVNTINYIKSREIFMRRLVKGIKKGGELLLVDFKCEILPVYAPPLDERVEPEELIDLMENFGMELVISSQSLLDYQYVLLFRKK